MTLFGQVQITEQTYYRWRKQCGGMGMHQLKELKRLQKMNQRLCRAVSSLTLDKLILSEAAKGNPARRRNCIDFVRRKFGVCERRACRVLQQHRSTYRYVSKSGDDEDRLVQGMIELARQYGRYGYRRIAAMLKDTEW